MPSWSQSYKFFNLIDKYVIYVILNINLSKLKINDMFSKLFFCVGKHGKLMFNLSTESHSLSRTQEAK